MAETYLNPSQRPSSENPAVCAGLDHRGVPVAMPAVLSVTMAVGARTLARKKAIVTRLAAMEELAGHRRPLFRQNRHADPEQADPGRAVLRERCPSRRGDSRRLACFPRRKPRPDRPRGPERLERPEGTGQIPNRSLPALRSRAQTNRGPRHKPRKGPVPSHQRRGASHPRVSCRCRRRSTGGRQSRARIRCARLSLPGCGTHR